MSFGFNFITFVRTERVEKGPKLMYNVEAKYRKILDCRVGPNFGLIRSDVSRKNKVTDNLFKIELDMDQASMKAFTQFHDKRI